MVGSGSDVFDPGRPIKIKGLPMTPFEGVLMYDAHGMKPMSGVVPAGA